MEWNNEQFFDRSPRGRCKGFSFGSRRRMLNRLNEVSTAARLPYFVTATLPDDVFDYDVARVAKTAKCCLDAFLKRLHRVSPVACGFWRIEWQARKSGQHEGKLFPHFHLLIWGLLERSLGQFEVCDKHTGRIVDIVERFESFVDLPDHQLTLSLVKSLSSPGVGEGEAPQGCHRRVCNSHLGEFVFVGRLRFVERASSLLFAADLFSEYPDHPAAERARKMSFCDWASLAWYHVVGSNNPDHLKAGLRVERVKSWGGVMSYCAKYMAKADCEFLGQIEFGRWWGIFNRVSMPWAKIIEINLDDEMGVRIRRVARRYLEHVTGRRRSAPYGLTLYCNVEQWSRLWAPPPDTPF